MNERTELSFDYEPDDGGRYVIRGRRLVRWITVLAVGIVAVLAVWQDTLN